MAGGVSPLEDRRLLGIGLVLVAYLLFTVVDTCAKWLINAGLPANQVVFVRYAGQFILVSALFLPARGREVLATRKPWLEVARGLCLMGSTLCNFTALLFLPLTVTASIAFTTPLMLCALSIPLLGETVGWRRWLAIGVGFVGVLVIIQPGTAEFHPVVFLSLLGALFIALYLLLTRKLAGVDSAMTQQFYAAAVATGCLVPLVVFGGSWVWPTSVADWCAFAGIGVAALVSHQFASTAHRFAPASVLAPFGYFQIIFMTASSWLVFNQPPTIWIYVGAPVVIASGLYIWLRERQLSKEIITEVGGRD
jgi:drug/metabolite transporter (DMT)-like permease